MMGIKEREFRPLPDNLSLEELVPKDNFYRRLEQRLDLSFIRELVADRYATVGRHSVDPVVFFRLQLVMFFEGIRSERELMKIASDRLSVRWYLGYDLQEPLPDHFQPHPDSRALWSRDLQGLLREDRGDVHRGRLGARGGAVLRFDQGKG